MAFVSAIYYVLWALNLYLVLRNKDSKVVVFITWILLFILFASNSAISGDAYKYKIDYEYGAFGTNWMEVGNSLLQLVCKRLGLSSYNQYLIVLYGISSVLLFLGIRKIKGNIHIILVATMGFIFPAMTVAIRYFIAFSIFVFCISYLLKGERIKYIIGIIIATTFHRSALFFLLFLLSETAYKYSKNDKYRRKASLIVGGIALGCAVYVLMFRRLPFVSLVSAMILRIFPTANMKVDAYFGSSTRFGFMIMWIVYITNFLFSRYMVGYVRKCNRDEKTMRISLFGYTTNVLSAVLLPLTVVNLVFFRLYFAQMIINCIVFGIIKKDTYPIHRFGVITISPIELYYFLAVVAWSVPAVFQVNSISVYNMIMDSLFV